MALRTKDVEIGGKTFRIANLQLRPQRELREKLEALSKAKPPPADWPVQLQEAEIAAVVASLRRVDPAATREVLDDLDGDDLKALYFEVMRWTGKEPEPGEGSTPGASASSGG